MIIRKMTEADISQLVEMEKQCFSDPWSAAAFSYELHNPLSLWLVAAEGDTVVGYVGSQTVMGEADMMNIAVSASYRRQGIGQQLVNALIELLDTQFHAHSLALEVRVSNEPAISLYEKLGFVQVGRRPGYYRNPREDAYILRKEWCRCE